MGLGDLFMEPAKADKAASLLHTLRDYHLRHGADKPIEWNLLYCKSPSDIEYDQQMWFYIGRLFSGNYIVTCTTKNWNGEDTIGVRLWYNGWKFVEGKEPV